MQKFMMLYKGPVTASQDISSEQTANILQAWGAWQARVGDAVVDVGSPMDRNGVRVADNGSEQVPDDLNGYMIVQAEDLQAAKALVEGHPFLSDNDGKFSIEIYQFMPFPTVD